MIDYVWQNVDNSGQANNAEVGPYLDPNEIFGDLGDLESLVGFDDGDGFSHGQRDKYTKNEMPSTGGDVSLFCDPHNNYLELIDLDAPLF